MASHLRQLLSCNRYQTQRDLAYIGAQRLITLSDGGLTSGKSFLVRTWVGDLEVLLEGTQVEVDAIALSTAELLVVSLDAHRNVRSAYLVEMDLYMLQTV